MLGVDLPVWKIVSASIVTFPVILYAQAEFRYWKDKRKAESLGARLAPQVPYRWPAGIDLIVAMFDEFKTGYLGESNTTMYPARNPHEAILGDVMAGWLAEGGQTINLRTLWTSRVSLLITVRLMILIACVDVDYGTALH